MDVYNLEDSDVSFAIRFVFFEEETNNILYSSIKESSLVGGANDIFENTFNIKSEGASGIANKDISCNIFTDKNPIKRVCD